MSMKTTSVRLDEEVLERVGRMAQDLDNIEAYISRDNSLIVPINIVLEAIGTVEKILPGHPRAGQLQRPSME